MTVPALLFHDVSTDAHLKPPGLTISPEQFRDTIQWLASAGYTGITARHWWEACNGRRVLPSKAVIITFDDGYVSIADSALPLLHSYGFSATIFVVTDFIGGTNHWDAAKWRELPLMSAKELCFWSAAGFEIASHSSTHHDLTTLSDRVLHTEISGSYKRLREVIGQDVVSFAYPYGRHNNNVRRAVSTYFQQAFSIQNGAISSKDDSMQYCRMEVLPTDTRFMLLLNLHLPSSMAMLSRLRTTVRAVVPPSMRHPLKRFSRALLGRARHAA